MPAISTVNDIYFRKFLETQLENKFDAKDMLNVIQTLNPTNERYRCKTNATPKNNSNHEINMAVGYQFPSEKSANLFKTLFEDIHQKGKGDLKISQKEGDNANQIIIKMKEPLVIGHKEKLFVSNEQQQKITEGIKYREESALLTDIMVGTIDALDKSGLYNMSDEPASGLATRKISSKKALNNYERKIDNGDSNLTSSTLYKIVMKSQSIEKNHALEKAIGTQIMKAADDRCDRRMCGDLLNRVFKSYDIETMGKALEMSNPTLKALLRQSTVIDQKEVNETMTQKILNAVGLGKDETEIKEAPKARAIRYK